MLCVICHDHTQITGGFGRKLNAGQVTRYRDDWSALVEARRTGGPVKFEPIENPEALPEVASAPGNSAGIATGDQSGKARAPGRGDSSESLVAEQLNLLSLKFKEQTLLNRQITATTSALTGITYEYNGAINRATLKIRLARNPAEVSKAREELADELIRIVTEYSIQAYAYRRIELETNDGFQDLLATFKKIPPEYAKKASALWFPSSRRLISARLTAIEQGQSLYNTVDRIKGGSPRLDSILTHMQEAQMQTLKNKEKYLSWLKELEALALSLADHRISAQ